MQRVRPHLSLSMLAVVPIIFIGLFIAIYSVNTPVADQWELVPMIQHLHAGHFIWTDYWWQHNEHRVLIPNLILTASALLTHWNTIVELVLGFLVSIASFTLLIKTLGITSGELKRKRVWWLPVVISIVWFSPVQVENWLWGWQLEWFLNVLGAVVVAYALTKIKNKDISWGWVILIIAGTLLAQFSTGNGTLLWLLALLALIYFRVSWFKSAIVAATGTLATVLYYHHYLFPSYPPRNLFVHEPVNFIKYVSIYLGRPLTYAHKATALMGVCLAVMFLCLNLYLLIRKREVFDKLIPWILLGLYAIASAMITGVSRLGYGLDQAYSSRYTTVAMLLLISLIVSLSLAHQDLPELLNATFRRSVLAVSTGALVFLLITNALWGVHSATEHRADLRVVKACTHDANPSANCLLLSYPYLPIIEKRLPYIKAIHYAGY